MADEVKKVRRVYAVIKRPKKDDFWLNIGTWFPHENGIGFNVLVQAIPAPEDGQWKFVLRELDPKEAAAEDAPSKK